MGAAQRHGLAGLREAANINVSANASCSYTVKVASQMAISQNVQRTKRSSEMEAKVKGKRKLGGLGPVLKSTPWLSRGSHASTA